ncbi:MAG: LysR family transcriptional regulator substrate-binding protein [Lachnospiraceae bacterium]|nr:LysR family transcriptional regulator substrate-binding protein [Lachnospiraceae bacterium]
MGIQNVTAIRDITLQYTNKHLLNENKTIEFLVAPPGDLLEKMDNGEVDICSLISFATLNRKNLKMLEIGTKREKPVIAISKDHPLAKKEKLTLEDIKDETILCFEKEYAEDAEIRIRKDFINAGIELKQIKKLKNIQEVKLAVYMNQGVALILDLVMEDLLDKVKLFNFKEMDSEEQASISLVWKDTQWDDLLQSNS